MRRNSPTLLLALPALAALALAACGGDDAPATDATSAATTPAEIAAPETAPIDTAPAATAAPDTAAPEEFVQFTADELTAALPTLADLGDSWTDLGGTPLVAPEANEGPGVGVCGGPNGAARAAEAGGATIVAGPNLQGSDLRLASTTIYVFADDTAAQGFLDLTFEYVNCPDGVTWERTQRANPAGPDEINGFGPGFEEVTEGQIWAFGEIAQSTYADGDETVLYVGSDRGRELTAADITFSQVDSVVARYDRYDHVVIVTQLLGTWDYKGYINLDTLVPYQPTLEHLEEYAAAVTPLVLERLGWEPGA